MLILLDTNVFWPDVHATKGWLSAVLDGASQGDFEVVVPETVIRELVKQYPERLADAVKESNAAAGAAAKELRRLHIKPPEPLDVDQEKLVSEYEASLRARLSSEGCRIEPDPAELGVLVEWAVTRRTPFKESGDGAPDAAIWLTTLELARDADQVLLASTNTEDFGDGESPPDLHPTLQEDLVKRGLPADRVRLVASTKALVEKTVKPMAEAEARARRLISEPEPSGRLRAAIQRNLLYSPIPQTELRLGVELDNDPQPIALDVGEMELTSVREAGDGDLFMQIRAMCDLHLDMAIFKADYAIAEDDTPISISSEDLNDHYFQGEAEITAWVTLDVSTDPSAENASIELVDAERLTDEEIMEWRLEHGAADALLAEVADPSSPGELSVDHYVPDLILQTGVDQASVDSLKPTSVRIRSVDDHTGDGVCCSLLIEAEGDVTWIITAPSGFDSDRYPSLSEAPDEGGWISDVASNEPLQLFLRGTLAPDGTWLDLETDEVTLEPTELERRISDSEAAEAELEIQYLERARERKGEGSSTEKPSE